MTLQLMISTNREVILCSVKSAAFATASPGGELFRTLLAGGLVDTVEVAVIPVLLGRGIPLLSPGATTTLRLVDHIGGRSENAET